MRGDWSRQRNGCHGKNRLHGASRRGIEELGGAYDSGGVGRGASTLNNAEEASCNRIR